MSASYTDPELDVAIDGPDREDQPKLVKGLLSNGVALMGVLHGLSPGDRWSFDATMALLVRPRSGIRSSR